MYSFFVATWRES